ncbi:MAG TPA: ChbG/HpnK family deacetylase [Pyrinomonadaceae bacterium]|nr:ChbG/HpnK family deacetylase [Pyrinomonadaceae bacterium]
MKQLIVNADDLGLTPAVNRGVVRAFQSGIVTSTSLLVTGSAFEDAVALARQNPELDVGLHLALVEERSVLGPDVLPTLVDETGRFPRTSTEFIRRAILGGINWFEVEREIAAQIALFQETGLRLSHLDSHQHLHMFPPVFQIVRRLARWVENVWIRNPVGPWRKSPDTPMGRWVQRLGLNLTCLSARRLRDGSQPQMPDGMYGFEVSGRLTQSALEQILRKIPDGLYELICHPGEDDAETRTRYSHWGYRWAEELEALTARETRLVLQEQGIVLTSFVRSTGNRCNAVFT